MTLQEKAIEVIRSLEMKYPVAKCSLIYQKPYELLIATRLSAQCTDARVNIVTKPLFERYSSIDALASANVEDVEEIIRSCGLYKTKAKSVVSIAKMLLDVFNGIVPDNMDDLLKLPGVGRKTANLILGDIYGKPAVVCDTHCIRINNRIGLIDTNNPFKAEKLLKTLLPPDKSNDYCHRLVLFGRDTCKAQKPHCESCEILKLCSDPQKEQGSVEMNF